MKHLSPQPAMLVWLFLAAATLGSAWLAEHHAVAGQWTGAFVMVVALLKGRAIMLYFMELRCAPRAWRIAFEVWGLAATTLIIGLWASAGGG